MDVRIEMARDWDSLARRFRERETPLAIIGSMLPPTLATLGSPDPDWELEETYRDLQARTVAVGVSPPAIRPEARKSEQCRHWATACWVAAGAASGGESDQGGFLSCSELAEKHKVPCPRLRKRLERWRPHHDADYLDAEQGNPPRPFYLYKETAVLPEIESLRAKLNRTKRLPNVG